MSETTTLTDLTLKSFEPRRDQNGQHRTWSNQRGTYWEFNVVLTDKNGNDITGQMNSSKDTPSWKVGSKIESIQKTVTETQNGTYTSFKGAKFEKTGGGQWGSNTGGGRSKIWTPEFRQKVVRSVCLEVAQQAFTDLNKTDIVLDFGIVEQVANVFVRYIYDVTGGDAEKESMAENSLRRAVEGLQFRKYKVPEYTIQGTDGPEIIHEHEGISTSAEIVQYAKKCFNYIWGKESA